MSDPELKPCPFCGGDARVDAMPVYVVAGDCYQCICIGGCASSSAYYDSEEDAVAAWNRRAGWQSKVPHDTFDPQQWVVWNGTDYLVTTPDHFDCAFTESARFLLLPPLSKPPKEVPE